jgi:uncharacterized protein
VGTALPLLIFGDAFAVSFYRRTTDWGQLRKLLPTVLIGFLIGSIALYYVPSGKHDPLNVVIGICVLIMVALSLVKGKWGERLVPTSRFGTVFTGSMAGFTTMVSNAAGPIMQIFLVATRMSKEAMLGTSSVFFFCINCAKIPCYLALSALRTDAPMWTFSSVFTASAAFPMIMLGTVVGRLTQKKIPQQAFRNIVIALAVVGALKLVFL